MGQIRRWVCKNDSDTECTNDCFPTDRDFELMSDSDSGTDPDMPPLARPGELKGMVKKHPDLLYEGTPYHDEYIDLHATK